MSNFYIYQHNLRTSEGSQPVYACDAKRTTSKKTKTSPSSGARQMTQEMHDKIYHNGHYTGGPCSWRDKLKQEEQEDTISLASINRFIKENDSEPFILQVGEGVNTKTYAYKRNKGTFVYKDKKGQKHDYEHSSYVDKFSFGKRYDPDKKVKEKPTQAFKANASVPFSGKLLLSEMSPTEYYTRANKPNYEGKKREGEPLYDWKIGGRTISKDEALALEEICKNQLTGSLLTPAMKNVRVRKDIYNGKNQICSYINTTGHLVTIYDEKTEHNNQSKKFELVENLAKHWEQIMGEIAGDCLDGSPEAQFAYFMTRSRARIGGSASNDNMGLLDLTPSNVKVLNGDTVRLEFDAKNAHWIQHIQDKNLARWMQWKLDKTAKGERLFKGLSTSKVNAYLTAIGEKILPEISKNAGQSEGENGIISIKREKGFTAHNVRHVGATLLANELVDKIKYDPQKSRKLYVRELEKIVRACAALIGDTGNVAFEKYISLNVLFKNVPDLLEQEMKIRSASAQDAMPKKGKAVGATAKGVKGGTQAKGGSSKASPKKGKAKHEVLNKDKKGFDMRDKDGKLVHFITSVNEGVTTTIIPKKKAKKNKKRTYLGKEPIDDFELGPREYYTDEQGNILDCDENYEHSFLTEEDYERSPFLRAFRAAIEEDDRKAGWTD